MSELINTIESPGEFDALTSLKPGEPYFPLVARDRLAPPLVDDWADKNRRRAMAEFDAGEINQATLSRELRKSTEAEMIACSMRAFKAGHEADSPRAETMPSPPPPGYPEEALKRDKLQSAKHRAREALSNAVAEVSELAELLEQTDVQVAAAIAQMAALAEQLTPPRPAIGKVAP
jgi:hypothetical protein